MSWGAALVGLALVSWLWMSAQDAQTIPGSSLQGPLGEHAPAPTGEAALLPDKVESPKVERSTVAVALTASAPTLTFAGCLIEKLEQNIKDDYPFGQGKPSVDSRIEELSKNATMNPRARALSPEQRAELRAILESHDLEEDREQREYWRFTRSALVAAAEAGRFLARECSVDDPAAVREAGGQAEAHYEKMRRIQGEMMTELSARLGVPLRDWVYSQVATSEPDGVPRFTIVYATREQAPDVFASNTRQADLSRAARATLRQFFASLP
jgi:hypothetical protein